MVGTAIPPVYLALNGTVKAAPVATDPTNVVASTTGYKAKTVSLTKAFTDAESPAGLTYTAVSTDPTIAKVSANATTGAVTGSTLTITGVKAGKTTITVNAFDGVNDGVPTTIDVIVVANNTPPAVSVTRDIDDLTGSNKLRSDSALEVPFSAVITPGVVGETEAVTFRVVTESGLATDSKYVSASATDGPVSGSYILTVKRISTGLNDQSNSNEITIFATDSFGAETMVDLNGTAADAPASLVVGVNAPPRMFRPLPSVVYLYRSGTEASNANVLTLTGTVPNTAFIVTDFFAVEMKDDADDAVSVDDTTCTFSTNPRQPTGYAAVAEDSTNVDNVLPAVKADLIKKATKATVSNGDMESHFPTSLVHAGDQATERARVVVNSAPTEIPASGATLAINAEGTGSFTLTITCRDAEKSVFGSSTIEVAN